MLTAPLKWVVEAIAWLPDLLRPGIFLVLVILAVWFVTVQRGLPALWAALCRGAARMVDRVVGLLVLPQYLVANARRRRGELPAVSSGSGGSGDSTFVLTELADRVLDGAATLYQSHQREPMTWKRPPWPLCVLVVALCAAAWVAMDRLPADSEAKRTLSDGYDYWRDVEDWADVDPSRRAEPGIAPPPRPAVVSVRRLGRRVGVRLGCPASAPCRGRLVVRSADGERLYAQRVRVTASSAKVVRVVVPVGSPRALRGSRVVVLRAR
ncbi:MAG TPA: hypothetical protein VNO82_07830 [Solirubrobacteraceae bacterium]|nr:hypothetical protein [Solirubrobacteraceae bacterium]